MAPSVLLSNEVETEFALRELRVDLKKIKCAAGLVYLTLKSCRQTKPLLDLKSIFLELLSER